MLNGRRSMVRLHAVILVALLNITGTTGAQEDVGQKIYKNTLKGTVWILRPVEDNKVITGSGVLVDSQKRIIVTNFHVVANAKQVAVFFPIFNKGEPEANRQTYLNQLRANRFLIGEVIHTNPVADLALVRLKTLPPGVKAVSLAKGSPKPADRVHSIGSPGAVGALWVYTPGSVRQVYKAQIQSRGSDGGDVLNIDAWMILTNSDTNEGDSGGPLVNDKGELIGITQGGSTRARGVSMFIDLREVKATLAKVGIRSPVAGETTAKNDDDSAASDQPSGGTKPPPAKPDTKDPEKIKILRLARELTNARSSERESVLDKFQNTKGSEYTQALASAIPTLSGGFRDKARSALAERLKRMTDRTLQEYLKDEDMELRRAAIGAIQRKSATDLLKDLIPLLSDAEKDVSEEAYEVLCKMTGMDFGRTPEKWQRHLNK